MKNNKLSNIVNAIILSYLAVVLSSRIYNYTKDKDLTSLSYSEIIKINPTISIDMFTLNSTQDIQYKIRMFNKGTAQLTLARIMGQIVKQQEPMVVLINSQGGLAYDTIALANSINAYKEVSGLNITCYIKTAMSAAFTLMLDICDKRIGMKNIRLMQHRVTQGTYNTIGTKELDMVINKREALILGVPELDWLKISKGKNDHHFTREEMIKFKLIHEFKE